MHETVVPRRLRSRKKAVSSQLIGTFPLAELSAFPLAGPAAFPLAELNAFPLADPDAFPLAELMAFLYPGP